jgi:Gpi18-like mannosyltransferase
MSTTVIDDIPAARHSHRSWRSIRVRIIIAYLLSRLCVLAGAGIVAAQQVAEQRDNPGFERPKNAVSLIVRVLTSWDGAWYYEIVRHWYPKVVPPNVTFFVPEARAAFFPAFPVLTKAADAILPGGDVLAGLLLNFVLGGIAIYLTGLLARAEFGDETAYRAMMIMAFFPGSFALSFAYSEALLIAVSAGCLLALRRERWWLAGVLAAIGTATRPNGVALCAACAVAAFIAIRKRRDWWSLVAPALSPIGLITFQVYLRQRTGEWAWARVQREAWHEGTSFGLTALRNTFKAFAHPLASPTQIVTAVSFLFMLFLIWVLWKRRLPWPQMAYIATIWALMILPSTVTARPRFLYTAFPAFIALAAWWPEDHDDGWTATVAMGAAGLVALTGLYGVLGAIP